MEKHDYGDAATKDHRLAADSSLRSGGRRPSPRSPDLYRLKFEPETIIIASLSKAVDLPGPMLNGFRETKLINFEDTNDSRYVGLRERYN
jgi:hypothetical protein